MRIILIPIVFILVGGLLKADEIHVPPGACITVPAGANLCSDTLTVDSNACFVAIDSSNICPGMVIRGNGSIVISILQISTEIPGSFMLHQNFPNPFNPVTKIKIEVAQLENNAKVKLIIFDALGKEVKILVDEHLQPGVYEVDFDGNSLTSGVYFCRFFAGDFTSVRKMVLLK